MKDIIKGLQIIAEVEPEAWGITAQHDEIYAGGDLEKYTDEQILELEELGFIYADDYGSFLRFV